MRFRRVLGAAILGAAWAAAAGAAPDFAARLELVKQADLSEELRGLAVKGWRPMPWAAFVKERYREFKNGGDVAGGDLGPDAAATIGLALLDAEYRRTGRLLYVKDEAVPGTEAGRWISLKEFETDIMPVVVRSPEAYDGGDTEFAVRELVRRATALHQLSWSALLLVPGEPEVGWRPLGPEDPLWSRVLKLNEAYEIRDAGAMRREARALGEGLAGQPGYPARGKLDLEILLTELNVLKVAWVLYFASALLFVFWIGARRRPLADAGAWVGAAGVVLMTAGLAGRSVIAGHLPVGGLYETLLLVSWAAVLFFLVFYARTRAGYLGAVVMPVAVLLAAAASFFPETLETQMAPALRSWWFAAHVVLASLGEGAFAVGLAAALLLLFRRGGAGEGAGDKTRLEATEYRAVAIGYPLFTAGALVAGAIWAQEAFSSWWRWTPKEAVSLVAFLLATAYMHARDARGWRGRPAAALVVLVFAAAGFSFFAQKVFGGGNPYGS